jgi:hypothetical protein
MEKQIILPENVELIEEVKTIYKDKDGKYYLSKEGAQEKLATHFKCECGNGIREKFRCFCDSCEPPEKPKQILSKDWDEESMLYVEDFDKYFSDFQEIEEYCDENEHDKHSLAIFICDGNYYNEITTEYWEDIMATEDDYVSLPKAIEEKLNELNEAIKNHKKPATWSPSRYRANAKWND